MFVFPHREHSEMSDFFTRFYSLCWNSDSRRSHGTETQKPLGNSFASRLNTLVPQVGENIICIISRFNYLPQLLLQCKCQNDISDYVMFSS